jgi:hypothetical protein
MEAAVRPAGTGLRGPAAIVAVLVVLTGVAFVAMPRLPGVKLTALPFSIAKRTPVAGFAGEVFNPGRAAAGGGFSPDAYFGYGDSLDLGIRGRLSDELVMRVRAPEGNFWRAQVYDVYDGRRWTSSDSEPVPARGTAGSIRVGPRWDSGHELVQTFFVERQLPNLVFHALEAKEIFTPASSVRVDRFGSIRLPFVLEADTIYSVISAVPDASDDVLRA